MSFLTLGLVLYFLPTLLAGSRRHSDATGVAVTNLLFGWTVVGWLLCLVWVLREPAHPNLPTYLAPASITAWTDYPAGWVATAAPAADALCGVCARPMLPAGGYCTMCGAPTAARP